jgi:hypothetical protein
MIHHEEVNLCGLAQQSSQKLKIEVTGYFLSCFVVLIILLSRFKTLEHDDQMLLQTSSGEKTVLNGPGVHFISPFHEFKWRKAMLLGPLRYSLIESTLTGELRVESGPKLLFLEPYDQAVRTERKVVLMQDEYLRLVDEQTGIVRVLRGPQIVTPGPTEAVLESKGKAAEINNEKAVLVLSKETGQQRLITEKGMFFPGPYEEILEIRKLIHVEPHEAIAVRNDLGSFTFYIGSEFDSIDGKVTAFFLPPYCKVITMEWSSGSIAKDKRKVTKIDLRAQHMTFDFEARTSDSVPLRLEGIVFWRVIDVRKMLHTTLDPTGDVWHHTRNMLIQALSQETFDQFMQGSNNIVTTAFESEAEGSFYKDRGLTVQSIEVRRFECKDFKTAEIIDVNKSPTLAGRCHPAGLAHMQGQPRRLSGVYGNVAAHTSATEITGCVKVALSSTVTLDLSSGTSCNSHKCPPCFIINTGHATNTLTLNSCSSLTTIASALTVVTKPVQLGQTLTSTQDAVIEIVIINSHTTSAIIRDGQSSPVDNIVGPKSHSIAYCFTGGSNALYFTSAYFNNGLSVVGAANFDGAASFDGAVNLGNENSDTVTIKGHVATTGNPNIDLSGSSGTFSSTTGANTIGGAATLSSTLAVTSTATFNGHVNLGNANEDTVTIQGHVATTGNPNIDLSGSSGTFSSTTGANTLGGAATLSSTLAVTSTATFNGAVNLGNANEDTVTIQGHVATTGNPNIDLSGSSGTFSSTTGANTLGGAATLSSSLTVTGIATFSGAVMPFVYR